MARRAVFEGLIVDEFDRPVDVAYVGDDPCYVVDDGGFRRHIDSKPIDLQVLKSFSELISGHEDMVSEQAAKMLGQDDLFSRANLANQIKNMDKYFDQVLETGIPEDQRAYMGMMGFRVRINVHGEVIEIVQPGGIDPDDEM
jgi:hypothetical protein